jgi:acyl-CoA reductase-like NAD-dependent aldehyde dehydrogenase
LLAEVLAEVFPIERVAVVQGGADVGAAFAASGGVNARNVARIAAGKFLNAGQTCIAPDDALVHEAERDAFVALLRTCVAHHYSPQNAGGDHASIVNGAQHARLRAWLDEARAAGARVIPLHEGLHDGARRVLAPTVVLDASDSLALMREETFGPVLPVMKYRISMKPWITSMSARDRCPCTCSTTTLRASNRCWRRAARAARRSTTASSSSRNRDCRSAASARPAWVRITAMRDFSPSRSNVGVPASTLVGDGVVAPALRRACGALSEVVIAVTRVQPDA